MLLVIDPQKTYLDKQPIINNVLKAIYLAKSFNKNIVIV